MLLPSELSLTILLLMVVANKLTPSDVQTTNYSLMFRSWLFPLDVSELLFLSWCVFLSWVLMNTRLGKVASFIEIFAGFSGLLLVSWRVVGVVEKGRFASAVKVLWQARDGQRSFVTGYETHWYRVSYKDLLPSVCDS